VLVITQYFPTILVISCYLCLLVGTIWVQKYHFEVIDCNQHGHMNLGHGIGLVGHEWTYLVKRNKACRKPVLSRFFRKNFTKFFLEEINHFIGISVYNNIGITDK